MKLVKLPYYQDIYPRTIFIEKAQYSRENTIEIPRNNFNAIDFSGLFPEQNLKLQNIQIKYAITYSIESPDSDFGIFKRKLFDNDKQLISISYIQYKLTGQVVIEEIFYDQNRNITKITSNLSDSDNKTESTLEDLYKDQFAAEEATNDIHAFEIHWTTDIVENTGDYQDLPKIADLSAVLSSLIFDDQILKAPSGNIQVVKVAGEQYITILAHVPHDFSTNSISVDGSPGNDQYPEFSVKFDEIISAIKEDLFV